MAISRAAQLALATAAFAATLGLGAPGAVRAASLTGAEVQTAADLLNLCADPSDPAKVACRFYIHGALQASQMMHAADQGKFTAMFCPPETLSTDDLVANLRKQVAAHQERRTFPAATVIIGGAIEAYPCAKIPASAAAPAVKHHRRRHRAKPKG